MCEGQEQRKFHLTVNIHNNISRSSCYGFITKTKKTKRKKSLIDFCGIEKCGSSKSKAKLMSEQCFYYFAASHYHDDDVQTYRNFLIWF